MLSLPAKSFDDFVGRAASTGLDQAVFVDEDARPDGIASTRAKLG
jgi:hypothetical protein